MMRLSSRSIALFGTVAMLLVPLESRGAQSPPASAAPTLAVTHAIGSEALLLVGDAQPNQRLESALYARFSRDLPNVLLGRRYFSADAAGHYTTTVPIASAFFRGAIVTAIVRTLPGDASAQASVLVTAPNVPAPPDDIPASVR